LAGIAAVVKAVLGILGIDKAEAGFGAPDVSCQQQVHTVSSGQHLLPTLTSLERECQAPKASPLLLGRRGKGKEGAMLTDVKVFNIAFCLLHLFYPLSKMSLCCPLSVWPGWIPALSRLKGVFDPTMLLGEWQLCS
jgi:hypothetical protein